MIDIQVYSRPVVEAMPAQDVPHLIVSINCQGKSRLTSRRMNTLSVGSTFSFGISIDTPTDRLRRAVRLLNQAMARASSISCLHIVTHSAS